MATSDDMRRWVETWTQAGPELAAIRREEIRVADNVQAIAALESLFNQSTHSMPPRETSGLVEMHKILAKLRG